MEEWGSSYLEVDFALQYFDLLIIKDIAFSVSILDSLLPVNDSPFGKILWALYSLSLRRRRGWCWRGLLRHIVWLDGRWVR